MPKPNHSLVASPTCAVCSLWFLDGWILTYFCKPLSCFCYLFVIEAGVLENVLGIEVVMEEVQDHIKQQLPDYQLYVTKINPLLDSVLKCSLIIF